MSIGIGLFALQKTDVLQRIAARRTTRVAQGNPALNVFQRERERESKLSS